MTGYNFELISVSSWVSKSEVLKNMSAMLSICMIWALIGFVFGERYLKLEFPGSLFISVCLVFIVIQIERQIIMSISKKSFLLIFRSVIGLMMALLGAFLLDQVVFSTDIEHKKLEIVNSQVDLLMRNQESKDSVKCEIIEKHIQEALEKKNLLLKEIAQRPVLKLIDSELHDENRTDNVDNVQAEGPGLTRTIKSRAIVNPNFEILNRLETELQQLRQEKIKLLNNQELNRNEIKSRLLSHSGFTEESRILFLIFRENTFAFVFWICLTLLIFAMELLILVNKISEPRTDYDRKLERELKENINKIDYQDDSMFL